MTEGEFNALADVVFEHIEQTLDTGDTDLNYDSNGTILEIEFNDGTKLVVNRHVPNREIWLAAKSGGYHYAWQKKGWHSQRDGSELYTRLTELVRLGGAEKLKF